MKAKTMEQDPDLQYIESIAGRALFTEAINVAMGFDDFQALSETAPDKIPEILSFTVRAHARLLRLLRSSAALEAAAKLPSERAATFTETSLTLLARSPLSGGEVEALCNSPPDATLPHLEARYRLWFDPSESGSLLADELGITYSSLNRLANALVGDPDEDASP